MARVWRGLFVAVVILVVLSAIGQWLLHRPDLSAPLVKLAYLFDLDGECNVPTWFSSAILLCAALILFVIASRLRAAGKPFARRWSLLGALVVLVSMDEVTHVHEGIAQHVIPIAVLGVPAHNWVFLAIVFLVGLFVAYLPLLVHLPARTRWGMIVAGAIYVLGAVGIEAVGFRLEGPPGLPPLGYVIASHIEESLEMIGVILFARTAWRYAEGLSG